MKAWLERYDFRVLCSTELSMGYPDSLTDLCMATTFLFLANQAQMMGKGDVFGPVQVLFYVLYSPLNLKPVRALMET